MVQKYMGLLKHSQYKRVEVIEMKDRVTIIAEAGINHNGSLELAKELARKAKEAGADYVKFQTYITENLVTYNAKKAEYQIENTNQDDSQFAMLKKLELTYRDFEEIKLYCESIGIKFLSTAFDFDSIDFLKEIGIDFWKIPSGEITNRPYLEKIAKTGMPIVLSTGMSNLQEIRDAANILIQGGSTDISILHCTTQYPTAITECNLNVLETLKKEFNLRVGYSDHTEGIFASVIAVARGARIIEKHFTLDRSMDGPDHKASLEPSELKEMVDKIREVEILLGCYDKNPTESEKKNMSVARKSIVAKCDINRGEIFSEKNISVKRPGTGINPMQWHEVIGNKAKRRFFKDEMIEL
jgi:N,N'-diacetyllegionaminate synthase